MSHPDTGDQDLSSDLLSALDEATASSSRRLADQKPAARYRFVRELGPRLQPPIAHPRLVACQPDGDLVVLEQPASDVFRLRRVGADGTTSSIIAQLSRGEGDSELEDPASLLIDDAGSLLILDATQGNIRRFSYDGRWLETIVPIDASSSLLSGPRDFALHGDGGFVVTDTNADRLLRVDGGGTLPIDAANLDLYEPRSVCNGPAGSLLVADTNNSRVIQLFSDARLRVLVSGKERLEFPSRVRVALDGAFFAVLDRGASRVQRFSFSGERTGEISTIAGGSDTGAGSNVALDDLALDSAGQAILINPARESLLILSFVE